MLRKCSPGPLVKKFAKLRQESGRTYFINVQKVFCKNEYSKGYVQKVFCKNEYSKGYVQKVFCKNEYSKG